MKVHYLEIVSPDVTAVCAGYEAAHGIEFGAPDALLGGAKTCELADGTIVGVRAPLRETETPIVRSYWLVDNIEATVEQLKVQGAEIALPPMEIPGKGLFAIYIQGAIEHGLWQL